MKKKSFTKKVITAGIVTGLTAGSIFLLNKIIFLNATLKERLKSNKGDYYVWRYGDIFYTVKGEGKPILLVHGLDVGATETEWLHVENELAKSHTVYTIDLLGCGRSDKPAITYTSYIYVQLINDFIKNIIGHKTDIVASGAASSLAIMACNMSPELYNRIMLVSPDSVKTSNKIPSKRAKARKFIIDFPIVGTLLYNIVVSKKHMEQKLETIYFSDRENIKQPYLDICHEAAHTGGIGSKFLYSSIKGNFIYLPIAKSLSNINNSMYILMGADVPEAKKIVSEYTSLNTSIEHSYVDNCKLLPHIEEPFEFLNACSIFFS